ncbi:MAG: molybdopterin molybdotransferase MoeA [Planctomycetia bacterium]|nr:molybdopterin molybdotransferase MoeA [Planctomycetia bacterium]
MLTVAEAIAAIVRETSRLSAVRVKLADALGRVLAEDAVSDLDSPPFDKALMDGYAIRAADAARPDARLRVIDEVLAGQVSRQSVGPGEAIRIMTGALVPIGADAVVPVERTRLEEAERDQTVVVVNPAGLSVGKNILKRGASTRQGTRVVPAGRTLRMQEIGALAELGRAEVAVFPAPRVAVLATGDELVPVEQTPGPGQIRNSNESMLVAQLRSMGAVAHPLGVARDDPAELRNRIGKGLAHDVLLLSGGVSAGKLDLVPAALAEAGVRQVFHKVLVKPGQPIWFGVKEPSGATRPVGAVRPCCVFGLPGNPVSSMVCCELFVRTAIRALAGIEPAEPRPMRGTLTRDHRNVGNRPTYHPAKWEWTEQGGRVEPVKWVGSADLGATVEANALAVFADADRNYTSGSIVDVLLF